MATKKDIQFHYDVDNNFFSLFLDKQYKMYSCGVWENASNLEEAQKNKLKRLSEFAHVKKGHRVLDIGCGWGGMLEYCVKNFEIDYVKGITLSQAQYDYIIQKNIPFTSIALCSWEDLKSDIKFDSIISIGAMEHFASLEDLKHGKQVEVYRKFFERCLDVSTQDSYLGLQTIITAKKPDSLQSMKDTYYLLKNVFPGSALPDIETLQEAMFKLYEPVTIKMIGLDYSRTLTEWKNRLNINEDKVMREYGKNLFNHYNHYFEAAIRSFENGYTSLLQMSLKKII